MFVNYDGRVAGNIARDFLFSFFINKASETTHINVVAVTHIGLYNRKESLNRSGNVTLINSSLVCDLVDDV